MIKKELNCSPIKVSQPFQGGVGGGLGGWDNVPSLAVFLCDGAPKQINVFYLEQSMKTMNIFDMFRTNVKKPRGGLAARIS